jgi:hypothetical protein
MKLARLAFALAAPLALQFTAMPAPAFAQSGPTAYERAILAGLDSPTRTEVQRRARGGDNVTGVVAIILLNNYQSAGPTSPGEAVSVVAVDFARGTVVLRKGADELVLHRFDPATLHIHP